MNFIDNLTFPDNLMWAWQKVQHFYSRDSNWFDNVEVARFELNLASELVSISKDLRSGTYQLAPIRPVPFPKRPARDGNTQVRQLFYFSVRDQVTWAAIVNVLGPSVDNLMPEWSYGNRLYRSAWLEESEGLARLRIGPYRHSSGFTYRKFQHSWPLYRRYILLTLRQMSQKKYRPKYVLTESEELLSRVEQSKSVEHRHPYLRPSHWRRPTDKIYWASLDFTKFYPKIDLNIIHQNLTLYSGITDRNSKKLLSRLLNFSINSGDFSADQLTQMGLSGPESVRGLPTGLIASGFLANVAMMSIDNLVAARVHSYPVAHFRYVDDHVILAPSFKKLIAWIEEYRTIINETGIASINMDKCEPTKIAEYLSTKWEEASDQATTTSGSLGELENDAKQACYLDPDYPTPLMTTTLAKVSALAKANFELLDSKERQTFLADVEHLLLADLPKDELKPDTRASFAASIIARLAPGNRTSASEIVRLMSTISVLDKDLDRIPGDQKSSQQLRDDKRAEIKVAQILLSHAIDSKQEQDETLMEKYLFLLLKALSEYPCVFHANPATDSIASLPPIPR